METHSSRSSGRSLRRLAALVAVAFAAIAGFTTLSGFVAASRAEADTCANYTYCLGFRSTMNNSALDGIYWSNEPTEQAVTDQNPVHGLWGVQFETWTDHAPMTIQNGVYVDGGTSPNTSYRDHAIFQLRSLSQPGGCLTEILSPRNQLRVTPCANNPQMTVDNQQQFYLVAGSDGAYSLRSLYDQKCVDVLNNSDGDGHWIGSWDCDGLGSSNQQWKVADYSGTAATTQSNGTPVAGSQVAANLASIRAAALGRDIRAQNQPGKITFCNWGGYLAEGVLSFYRTGSTTGNHWSTPVLGASKCATFSIPRGQDIQAEVELHEFSGMYFGAYGWKTNPDNGGVNLRQNYWTSDTSNDVVAAAYSVGGDYSNITFNFYGTTCYPSTTVNYNDTLSRMATVVVDNHQHEGCRDSQNFGVETFLGEAVESIEDLTDGMADFMRWLGGIA